MELFSSIALRFGTKSQDTLLKVSEAEVLDLGVLVDPVLGALAADAGLLDATEGALGAGHHALVDADHAGLHLLADAPALADVVGVEVAGQTDGGVVGEVDGLLLLGELHDGEDGAEDLVLEDLHLGGEVGEDGGVVVEAAEVALAAAVDALGALGHGLVDHGDDPLELPLVDKGSLEVSYFHIC